MWDRWKKRLSNIFLSEEANNEPKDRSLQTFKAKVTYQYPNHSKFRFPVIPDHDLHKPAYQRVREKQNYLREQKEVREVRERTSETEHVKEPFKPTQVASPIYGYRPRNSNEVDSIPAYVRKKRVDSHAQSNDQLEMKEDKSNIEDEHIKSSKEKKTFEEDVGHQTNQPINNVHTTKQINQKKENKHHRARKQTHINRNQKHKRSSQQNSVPFNVIMTPRDKKRLREKRIKTNESIQSPKTKHLMNNYHLPIHYLNEPQSISREDKLWVQNQQQLLEQTLKHFNVKAKVVNATQGPSVTRFEVQPELGVKVSRVRNLSDDIKLNMAAKDIRIEAPIPGKHTIGIEVPNLNPQTVGLQEIFETNLFNQSSSPLTVGLGLDVEGLPMVTNISKMPHGLIAGATGSGKSVCINTILISLLYKAHYEDVKLLLIDPKMVELASYNGIPHLISPVITDVKAATAALKWAVNEMEERYEKFVSEGVRNIERYNELMIKQNRIEEKMPFIVIVIDELADLMMASPQDVEDSICKIAQKARACGMHLLLATQRPSVDVITGLIKANIPTRIAFSVSSQVDSRTIIDTSGAERLLGKGDMLFVENGSGKAIRLQGAFVSDEEIERVTSFVRTIAPPSYLFEEEQLLKKIETLEDEDEILEEVINFVIEQTTISTSLLQRQFRIGYNRAARLIDSLENKGIISGQSGSKPRDVLLSKSQLESIS